MAKMGRGAERSVVRMMVLAATLLVAPGCQEALEEEDTLTLEEEVAASTLGDPDISTQPLIGGTITLQRPEIGRLFFGGGACTATLISSRALITAKHCVGNTSCDAVGCGSRWGAQVALGDGGRSSRFAVERFVSLRADGSVVPHLQGDGNRTTDGRRSDYLLNDDVALVLLSKDVPASVARPAGLAAARPTTGDPLRVWGYGCTHRGGQADGSKRYGDFKEGQRSDQLCPGDSGGPVTAGPGGGVLYVNSGYTVPRFAGQISQDVYGDAVGLRRAVTAQLVRWAQAAAAPSAPPAAPRPPAPPPAAPPELSFVGAGPFTVPDGRRLDLTVQIAEPRSVAGAFVEMQLDHARPEDLAVVLHHPSGEYVLLQRPDIDSSTQRAWSTDAFDSLPLQGRWTLQIYDLRQGIQGAVRDLEVRFPSPDARAQ